MNITPFDFSNRLEPEAWAFLEKHTKPVSAKKGHILFYQGDVCDAILLLLSGTIRLYVQADGVEDMTLYHLNPGEQCIVNTASTLSQTPAIGTAVTLSAIEGYRVELKDIKQLAKISEVYQEYLFSLYSLRFESLVELVSDIKFKTLRVRLLEWLQRQPNKQIVITHENLAHELGTSRVVVSRELKQLEKQAHIRLHRGSIELL